MTAPIKAIETSYAGCRFRSRLEARWAVFFDHLDIEWQYEPQGYVVGPNGETYLPDFWLPGMKRWVEIKGNLTAPELSTLIWAASAAGLPLGPDKDWTRNALYPWRPRILLLGDIPEPGYPHLHRRLDAIATDIIAWTPFFFAGDADFSIFGHSTLNQYIAGTAPDEGFLKKMTRPSPAPFLQPFPHVDDAYRAARSARFEHGEHG